MHRTILLIVTGFSEGGIGLLLLVWPLGPIVLLLGVEQASPEALTIARIAGAALLALGVACWSGRDDHHHAAQQGLLLAVLIYDLAAAGILAYTGWVLSLAGIALWPAVAFHTALAVWCALTYWGMPYRGGLTVDREA